MRVLLDTNVLISSLWWPGPSRRIWEAVREEIIQAVTSPALLRELCNVLTRSTGSFRISAREYRPIERQILRHCALVVPQTTVAVLADEADNRVLEGAVAGNVDLVVTGDKGLLGALSYRGIRIVPPASAWREISAMPRPIRHKRKRF